jgi:hypothetical protein
MYLMQMGVVHNWDMMKFEGALLQIVTVFARATYPTGFHPFLPYVFAIIKPSQTCPAVSYLKHHMQKFVGINCRSSFSCYI